MSSCKYMLDYVGTKELHLDAEWKGPLQLYIWRKKNEQKNHLGAKYRWCKTERRTELRNAITSAGGSALRPLKTLVTKAGNESVFYSINLKRRKIWRENSAESRPRQAPHLTRRRVATWARAPYKEVVTRVPPLICLGKWSQLMPMQQSLKNWSKRENWQKHTCMARTRKGTFRKALNEKLKRVNQSRQIDGENLEPNQNDGWKSIK